MAMSLHLLELNPTYSLSHVTLWSSMRGVSARGLESHPVRRPQNEFEEALPGKHAARDLDAIATNRTRWPSHK